MKSAIVTGAASGMGRATAEHLTEQGWQVLALDRATTEIPTRSGIVRTVSVDVTDRDGIARALDVHLESGGAPIGLVANIAGVYPPIEEGRLTTWIGVLITTMPNALPANIGRLYLSPPSTITSEMSDA